jgi:hypothetical protein
MVIDSEGQYSDIHKFEVRTSYDGARTNAEDFDKWWNGDDNGGAELSSLVVKPLFSKKSAQNAKYSEQNITRERKVIAHDEISAIH